MNADDWEDMKEEVCTHLETGLKNGETELETMTRLVWLERQRHVELCTALELILKISVAALERERNLATKGADVLEWKTPVRSIGPV